MPVPVASDGSAGPRPAEVRQLLVFRLGGGLHAIDLLAVREVIPSRRATRLPGAPAYVSGLINVRGTIVTVIDLAARLSGEPAAAGGSTMLVELGGKTVGFAVDEVTEVRDFLPHELEGVPTERAEGGAVVALGHLGDSVVIVLDIHAMGSQLLG